MKIHTLNSLALSARVVQWITLADNEPEIGDRTFISSLIFRGIFEFDLCAVQIDGAPPPGLARRQGLSLITL